MRNFTSQMESVTPVFTGISNAYQNPMKSMIRELVANGIDEHLAHGVDRPVEVRFPSLGTGIGFGVAGEVSVRDFGPGLSCADIESRILGMGVSTKRSEASSIGNMGFGAKSVFAISSIAYFESWKDGRYSLIVGQDTGTHAVFYEDVPLDTANPQPNGTLVTVPGDGSPGLSSALDATRFFPRGSVSIYFQGEDRRFDGEVAKEVQVSVDESLGALDGTGYACDTYGFMVNAQAYPVIMGGILYEKSHSESLDSQLFRVIAARSSNASKLLEDFPRLREYYTESSMAPLAESLRAVMKAPVRVIPAVPNRSIAPNPSRETYQPSSENAEVVGAAYARMKDIAVAEVLYRIANKPLWEVLHRPVTLDEESDRGSRTHRTTSFYIPLRSLVGVVSKRDPRTFTFSPESVSTAVVPRVYGPTGERGVEGALISNPTQIAELHGRSAYVVHSAPQKALRSRKNVKLSRWVTEAGLERAGVITSYSQEQYESLLGQLGVPEESRPSSGNFVDFETMNQKYSGRGTGAAAATWDTSIWTRESGQWDAGKKTLDELVDQVADPAVTLIIDKSQHLWPARYLDPDNLASSSQIAGPVIVVSMYGKRKVSVQKLQSAAGTPGARGIGGSTSYNTLRIGIENDKTAKELSEDIELVRAALWSHTIFPCIDRLKREKRSDVRDIALRAEHQGHTRNAREIEVSTLFRKEVARYPLPHKRLVYVLASQVGGYPSDEERDVYCDMLVYAVNSLSEEVDAVATAMVSEFSR